MRLLSYGQLLAKQKEVNQTMGDFLSVATHELKAPMSIIKGYISNVIDDTQPPLSADTKEQLNVALSQTDRLNGLVLDLLNVSRIEQGRVPYNAQPVILDEILAPLLKNYQMMASEKNIEITYESKTELIVYADAGRVQEVFTNLIDNAVKYSLRGAVTITQKVSGKFVVTSVRDTGIGMGPDELKRLFQRFYRIKNDNTKDISGTGLGLWIIKQYIEAMGGSIEVESMENVGSEFIVSLPLYNSQASRS
jgi:signal transduction histidine kinase